MANFKINPVTGQLDLAGGGGSVDTIEGNNGKATTSSTEMVSDTTNMGTTGALQVLDSSDEPLFEVNADTVAYSKNIEKKEEPYFVNQEIGRNWLFASATNVRQALVKCTMPVGQTVSMFGGGNRGVVTTIFFGDHPSFSSPFTVVVPGTGITGYANGILMSNKGDSITLRQVGASEYVVVSANFDITSQRA